MDYLISCPTTTIDLPSWNNIVLPYLPDYVKIMYVIPSLKEGKQKSCKWRVLVNDERKVYPLDGQKYSLLEYLETHKPRNSSKVGLEFSYGTCWLIEYTLVYCPCQSVFYPSKLEYKEFEALKLEPVN